MEAKRYSCCSKCGKLSESKNKNQLLTKGSHVCAGDPDMQGLRPKPLICRICREPFCRPFHGIERLYACRLCMAEMYHFTRPDQDALVELESPSEEQISLLERDDIPIESRDQRLANIRYRPRSLALAAGPSSDTTPQTSSIGIEFARPTTSEIGSVVSIVGGILTGSSVPYSHTWYSRPQVRCSFGERHRFGIYKMSAFWITKQNKEN